MKKITPKKQTEDDKVRMAQLKRFAEEQKKLSAYIKNSKDA